ncbi:MAG: sugar porter family MFS transporter, partial [Planctomycetes bacterium]|nr:sugar porter family MFS transporter [Planctomycetota bacterium]
MTHLGEPSHPFVSPIDERGSTAYVFVISAVAAVGGLLFGFDTAIIAGAIEFVRTHFALDPMQEGWAVGSLLIGCMVGAASAGIIADRFGRKKVLLITAALYIISAVLAGIPRTLQELVIARFLGGLAVGISSMVSPMYIAEIAPARIRGALVTLNQMAIVTGILLANLAAGLLVDTGENNWRYMFASAAVPSLLLLVALFAVPESPRWLAKQGLSDRALAILARVGGRSHAEVELGEIQTALAEEGGAFRELFGPGLRVALVIGVVLAVLGQISGINTVIYYAPKIFLKAGYAETSSATWANVMVGTTNFVITIVSLAVIDRIGRKALLMIGTAGMAVSMAVAGMYLTSETVSLAVKVAAILLYIASFGLGVGGVVWVVIAEIFPTKIRGRAVSVATVAVWAACY